MKRNSLNDFIAALNMLDGLLEREKISGIDIYAIGGFAMLYYGIRKDGYTIDIDSLTKGYDDKVLGLVKEVGKELGIDSEWLNTDCAELEGFLGLSEGISWKNIDYEFRHINLKIADIKGLIGTKAKAIHDGGLVPRSTDKKDLIALLKYVGIDSISTLDKSSDYGFIKQEYTRCYNYLNQIITW